MQPRSRTRPSACCLRPRPFRTGGAPAREPEIHVPAATPRRLPSEPLHCEPPGGSSPPGAGAFVFTGERMLAMTRLVSARRMWLMVVLCAVLGVARADDADPPGR